MHDMPTETGRSYATRQLVRVIGLVAVSTMFIVSASMNVRFGASLANAEADQHLYAMASLSADIIKALLPLLIIALWRTAQRGIAVAAALVWLLAVAWSLASAFGFASSTRDGASADRQAILEARAQLSGRIERLETQLKQLPTHRPAGTIRAAIENAQVPRNIWVRTKQCTDVTRTDSLDACQEVLALRSELAVATDAAATEERLDQAKGELRALPVVGSTADAQVDLLARLIPDADKGYIQIGLALLITALIETGSALGFTIVASGATAMTREIKDDRPARAPPPVVIIEPAQPKQLEAPREPARSLDDPYDDAYQEAPDDDFDQRPPHERYH